MNSNPNNIFFTVVTIPNSDHVFENDFPYVVIPGINKNFSGVRGSQWQLYCFFGKYT